MKLTIIQTGEVPLPLRDRFGPYRKMFETMFDGTGQGFTYDMVPVSDGAPLPDPGETRSTSGFFCLPGGFHGANRPS